MREVHVYEPALCCATGVCGPGLDQRLVTFTADVAHVNGAGGQIVRPNRQMSPGAHYTTPLMRLQDPHQTKVVLITLPETTPVLEAEALQADLGRAGISPYAWVVNTSLTAAAPSSRFLQARAAAEAPSLDRVARLSGRVAILPMLAHEPVGTAALSALTQPTPEGNLIHAR